MEHTPESHFYESFEWKTLDDIIILEENINSYNYEYYDKRINLCMLYDLIPYLKQLNDLIGMKKLKHGMLRMCLHYLPKANECKDMLHTVLYGSPGCGKTTVADIICNIYSCFNPRMKRGQLVKVKRDDFEGKYVGQTVPRIRQTLEDARKKGAGIFIDEAYGLVVPGSSNTFAKEFMDFLNAYLTEHKEDFYCVIAGYEDDLKRTFFSINKGLERRFPWRFHLDEYDANELQAIFKKMIVDSGWGIVDDDINKIAPVSFFKTNKQHFLFFGGDIEVLLTKCKVSHDERVFLTDLPHKVLIKEDVTKGFAMFRETRKKEELPISVQQLYM